MDDQHERSLAQGLRAGQVEAWRTLYETHVEQVWRTVARLLGPRSADVADVVQETFLSAARAAATFDPNRGSLGCWLWGIARRHVALHLRRREKIDRVRQDGPAEANPRGMVWRFLQGREERLPEEALASAELADLVRATLATLPDDYAMLLTARYLDAQPVEQIAAQVRSTAAAVRSKLARARQAFRLAFTANPAAQEIHPA